MAYTPMICCTCESTAEPVTFSLDWYCAMEMACYFVTGDVTSDPELRLFLQNTAPSPLLDALGLHDRCADCFWWRLALLLGYCVLEASPASHLKHPSASPSIE